MPASNGATGLAREVEALSPVVVVPVWRITTRVPSVEVSPAGRAGIVPASPQTVTENAWEPTWIT